MVKKFSENINSKNLFNKNESILLAVSGGVDSMVMIDLFEKASFNFSIAHCNFKLRGEESNNDELLVRKIGEKFGIKVFVKQFETQKFAETQKVSIQMAARELRYSWFHEIMEKENFTYLAIAQHKDDALETFFINLTRGTSISGLHGIIEKKDKTIRPLLFASKSEIVKYANDHQIEFRVDRSNSSEKYVRNKIRHSIIPLFKEINPSFLETMTENIEKIQFVEKIYLQRIKEIKEKILVKDKSDFFISIDAFQREINSTELLFELLKEFNFNQSVVSDIFNSLELQSGKTFYSSTHRLIKDRNKLLISKVEPKIENEIKIEKYYIENDIKQLVINNNVFNFELIENNDDFVINKISSKAFLDYKKLEFPLIIRKWKKGDSFFPFGMNQFKKVSDFFIDNKVSIKEKEEVFIVCSGENIVWVSNYRIDNRYRINDTTKKIYYIDLVNKNN